MTDRLSIAARFWRARHRKGWMVSATAPRTLHVLPLNDRIEHTESADCACGPRVDCVENDDAPRRGNLHPREPRRKGAGRMTRTAWWGTCDTCLTSVVVYPHPERADDIPPINDWDSFPDCYVCDERIDWGGSDPVADVIVGAE